MFNTCDLFVLFTISMSCTTAFIKAPGTVTLKIGIPEVTDSCYLEECRYNLEFCVGSGRLDSDRCHYVPKKSYNGQFKENLVVEESFDVENIRSLFFFNANYTFYTANKANSALFKDNLIQYSSTGTQPLSLYSESFVSMAIKIDVKCKSGYYPQFQCTTPCFREPGVSDCDANGKIICLNGYVPLSSNGQCVKDVCKLKPDMCQNNSTCENELNSVRCVCPTGYSGTACQIWNPCGAHNCQNAGICFQRTSDYVCQCRGNYFGKYCENVVDPCFHKQCPSGSFCKRKANVAICMKSPTDEQINMRKVFTDRYELKVTTAQTLTTTKKIANNKIKINETVRLIQSPAQKDYTAIIIIIVLLVFIICCFGITFWMQRKKYFSKKLLLMKQHNDYPTFPQMPSIITTRSQRSLIDHYFTSHSMDDVFAPTLTHHRSCCHFSTMSCKSGFNSFKRMNDDRETECVLDRKWPQKIITITESADTFGDKINESTQTNVLQIEDCSPIIENDNELELGNTFEEDNTCYV